MKITCVFDPRGSGPFRDADRDRALEVCRDYCETVDRNIESFLKDKTQKMTFALENAAIDFEVFWQSIGAEGDLAAAKAEWTIPHNASRDSTSNRTLAVRIFERAERVLGDMFPGG